MIQRLSEFSHAVPASGLIPADTVGLRFKRFSGQAELRHAQLAAYHPKLYRAVVEHDRYPSPNGRSNTPLIGPSTPGGTSLRHTTRLALWITSRDTARRAGKRPAVIECSKTGRIRCGKHSLSPSLPACWPLPRAATRTLNAAFRARLSVFLAPNSRVVTPRRVRSLAVRRASYATTYRRSSAAKAGRPLLTTTFAALTRCQRGLWRARTPDRGR